jgi:hypothetical protein
MSLVGGLATGTSHSDTHVDPGGSVADSDPDPDPACYFDTDPDPDPDPSFHSDADSDPSFQIKAQYLEKVLK